MLNLMFSSVFVTIKYVMNKFRNKIFRDFEENLYCHLNIPLSNFCTYSENMVRIDYRFDDPERRAEELRLLMDVYVNGLSIIYTEVN